MKKKKGRGIALYVIILILLFILAGCTGLDNSKGKIAKKGLKEKYNEDFEVYEINGSGLDWSATVSPKNRPDIVFNATFLQDGTVERDEYYQAYVGNLIELLLRQDLIKFFPDSFIRVDSVGLLWNGNGLQDFRNMSLEEVLINSIEYEGAYSGCFVDIYINKEANTIGDYEGEYNYFTNTVNKYIDEKKMIPLKVTFYKIDKDTLNKIEDYFLKDLDEDSEYEKILGIDKYRLGIYRKDTNDLGSPPNITACFDEKAGGYIGDYDEYERRRKELDNVK